VEFAPGARTLIAREQVLVATEAGRPATAQVVPVVTIAGVLLAPLLG
jgi:hypothetical protein